MNRDRWSGEKNDMALRIAKRSQRESIKKRVEDLSGVNTNVCLQCKRCSNGCPIAMYTESSPAEIIKLLQLGAGDELLDNNLIWICASCNTCFSRCPMEIDMAAVMDALRILAVERGAATPEGNMPLMNRILLRTIKSFGRTYDMGAMILYKIGTSTYLNDLEKFPMLLKKGKIALLPPRGADKKKVKRILQKFDAGKENHR
jgi:heterodisulfide reductase subunit C